MKNYKVLKLTMFLWGMSFAIVLLYAAPSNVIAYGGVYDAFGINEDGTIIAPGGFGYPPLYYDGYQWSISTSYSPIYGNSLTNKNRLIY